ETEWTQTFDSFSQTVASIDGRVTSQKQTIDGITSTVSGHGGRLTTVEQTASGLQSEVYNADGSSKVTQLANGLSSVVTNLSNLEGGGRNIIPNSSNLLDWSKWSLNTSVIKMTHGMYRVSRESSTTGGFIGIHSKGSFVLKAGNEYKISYKAHDFYGALPNYIYILSSEQGNTQLSNLDIKLLGRTGTLVNQSLYANQYKLTFTFTKDVKDGQILIGYSGGTTSHPNIGFYISDVQLEKGNQVSDWTPAPEDMATQAQLSVLNDNINMRVSKGELMSQINIEAGRTLIQSNKLYLDAQSVVFSGQAFIPGAVIENASIDGAKIANATIGSAKIASLDVNK